MRQNVKGAPQANGYEAAKSTVWAWKSFSPWPFPFPDFPFAHFRLGKHPAYKRKQHSGSVTTFAH